MSIRADSKAGVAPVGAAPLDLAEAAGAGEQALGEGNSFSTAGAENPLKRNIVVSIRASLNDLCLSKSKGTWAPSQEALRSIFQQRKFTSLEGTAEPMGDLKSIVLHDMKITHVKSNFPVALGARITGVDDCTFSSTGEAFSTIVLPNCESNREKQLQSDDVSLAYEFAKKFPCALLALTMTTRQPTHALVRLLAVATPRPTSTRRACTRSRSAALCLSQRIIRSLAPSRRTLTRFVPPPLQFMLHMTDPSLSNITHPSFVVAAADGRDQHDVRRAFCLSRASACCLRFFRYRSASASVIPAIFASLSLSARARRAASWFASQSGRSFRARFTPSEMALRGPAPSIVEARFARTSGLCIGTLVAPCNRLYPLRCSVT